VERGRREGRAGGAGRIAFRSAHSPGGALDRLRRRRVRARFAVTRARGELDFTQVYDDDLAGWPVAPQGRGHGVYGTSSTR
jgi:hypothetical protein